MSDIAYCTNCKAITFHDNGACAICGQSNKIYENLFHDPNVLALQTSRDSQQSRKIESKGERTE